MHLFFILYAIVLVCVVSFLCAAALYFEPETWRAIGLENGIIETATATIFFSSAVIAGLHYWKTQYGNSGVMALVMTLFAMREMDLHSAWTTDSILKSNFYTNPDASITEKTIGVIIIFGLVVIAYQLLKKLPLFVHHLFRGDVYAWGCALGIGLIFIGKFVDSMERLVPFLKPFHRENAILFTMVEETCELGGSVYFLLLTIMILFAKYFNIRPLGGR